MTGTPANETTAMPIDTAATKLWTIQRLLIEGGIDRPSAWTTVTLLRRHPTERIRHLADTVWRRMPKPDMPAPAPVTVQEFAR